MSRWPPLTVIDSHVDFLVLHFGVSVWESLRISRDDSVRWLHSSNVSIWLTKETCITDFDSTCPGHFGILLHTFSHGPLRPFLFEDGVFEHFESVKLVQSCHESCRKLRSCAPLRVQFLGRDLASPVQPNLISPALIWLSHLPPSSIGFLWFSTGSVLISLLFISLHIISLCTKFISRWRWLDSTRQDCPGWKPLQHAALRQRPLLPLGLDLTSLDESRRVSTSLLVLDTTLNTANSEVETVGSLMIFDDLCKSDASLMQVWWRYDNATPRLVESWWSQRWISPPASTSSRFMGEAS
jgi:hypothetical protein